MTVDESNQSKQEHFKDRTEYRDESWRSNKHAIALIPMKRPSANVDVKNSPRI